MPWSNGTFTRTNGTYTGSDAWQSDASAGTKILASNHDVHDQDIASGINSCLHKGGQNAATGDISWGNFKITNLGTPTNPGDAVPKSYLKFTNLSDTPANYTGSTGKYVESTGTGLQFTTLATVAETGILGDLTNVDVTGAASTNVLKYNGANWVDGAVAWGEVTGKPSFVSALGDLSDVDTTGAVNGKIIKYNGSTWVVADDSGAGGGASSFIELSDTPVGYGVVGQFVKIAADGISLDYGYLSPVATAGTIESLSNVDTTGVASGNVLKYDGANWVDGSVAWSEVTGTSNVLTTSSVLSSLSNVSATAPSNGEVLKWNGSQWAPGTDNSGGNTNLSTTYSTTTVTVNSDTGTDAIIATASGAQAGVMSTTLYNKLNGIESGATADQTTEEIQDAAWGGTILGGLQQNITVTYDDVNNNVDFVVAGTDIAQGTRTATTVPITSSTGGDATLSAATGSLAGVMAAADKTKLDGIETGAQVNVATNLAQGVRSPTTVPVTSSTGSNATLTAASTSLAGVMAAADKTKLDGIETGAEVNDPYTISTSAPSGGSLGHVWYRY